MGSNHSKVENGYTDLPNRKVLIAIQAITGVSLDYLIAGKESEDKPDRFWSEAANEAGALIDGLSKRAQQYAVQLVKMMADADRLRMEEYDGLIRLLEKVNQALTVEERSYIEDLRSQRTNMRRNN